MKNQRGSGGRELMIERINSTATTREEMVEVLGEMDLLESPRRDLFNQALLINEMHEDPTKALALMFRMERSRVSWTARVYQGGPSRKPPTARW